MRAAILYPRYFSDFKAILPHPLPLPIARKPTANDLGWRCFGDPAINLYVAASMQKHAIMTGLMAATPAAKLRYEAASMMFRDQIDRELFSKIGEKPHWGLPPGGKVKEQIIFLQYHHDINDPTRWPDQHRWLSKRLIAVYEVVGKYI